MDYMIIASAVEDVLLEKMALREIADFHIEIIQDDGRLEIQIVKLNPVEEIKLTFTIGSKV